MVSLPNHPDQTATAAVTRGTIRVVLAMLVMGSCVLGCSRPAPKSTIEIPCSFTGRCQVPMGRYGIACVIAPGNSYPSYSADSIGKPGVPELSKYQKAIIRRIQFRTKSRSIPFVPSRHNESFYPLLGDFIVFDAVPGPCSSYYILNQRVHGNEFYSPTLLPGPFPMT